MQTIHLDHGLLVWVRPRRRVHAQGARLARLRRVPQGARLRGAEGPRPRVATDNDELSITTGYQQVIDATGGTLDALYSNGAFAKL